MHTKTAPVKVKAGPDSRLGTAGFEAMVAGFGTVDSDGDRVIKGAFTDTLDQWAKGDNPLPVIWTHDHSNPFAHIGVVTDAKETDEGLVVKGQLDVDDEADNRLAKQVYRLLKGGRVTNWSYAYDVLDEKPGDDANDLLKLGLHEVGPTLVGSNRDTRTLDVKAADDPAQRLNALLDEYPHLLPALK